MQGMPQQQQKRLKSNTLSFQELPRQEDLFLSTFEDACRSGCPQDPAGLKRLRGDLESIQVEANKRAKLLAFELSKLYDMVDDPPEVETINDEVLLYAWRDKTIAELQEIDEYDRVAREAATAQAAAQAAAQAQAQAAARAAAAAAAASQRPAVVSQRQAQSPRGGGAYGAGAGRAYPMLNPGPPKRKGFLPWPTHVPFVWRDSMRVRFHVGGV